MSTTTHTKLVRYGATLESQVIHKARFTVEPSKRTGTLDVLFRNKEQYHFEGVPEAIFLGLLHAESHGQYFIKHIKNNYEYVRED